MLSGTCCCLCQPSCEMHSACTAMLGKRVKAGPACAAGPAAAVLQQGPSTAARRTHATAPPLDPVQPPDAAHKLVQNTRWAAPRGSAHSPMPGWLPSVLQAGLLCLAATWGCMHPRATSDTSLCCQTCLLCWTIRPITSCRYQSQRWAHRCSREREQRGGEDAGCRDGGQLHQQRAAAQPAASHQPHRAALQAAQRRWASASGTAAAPVM